MNTINVSASDVLNANILIVDDHDTNTIPLKRLLNNSGYRNVSFSDDFHGVLHLHRQFHYDLILMNLQMSGVEESDMLEGLRKIEMESALPILAIVEKSTLALRTLTAKIKDFIRKPFDMFEVKIRIHNMLVIHFLNEKIKNYLGVVDAAVQERTAELKESEARLRSLIELSSDWYWEQDRFGKFTKVSGPVVEMLGLAEPFHHDAHTVYAHHWHKNGKEKLNSNISAGRPFIDFPFSVIKSDGSLQYLRVSGEPIFDAAGCFSGYRGVGVDVSEYMDMAVDENLPHSCNGADDIEDAIFFVKSTDMHLLDANDAASTLLGYTHKEFLALNFENIVSCCQSDLHRMAHCGGNHYAQKKIDTIQIKHKDGSFFPAEIICRNSKRSRETNTFVIFIHKI
jgi:PAS domain S-box-containing protein